MFKEKVNSSFRDPSGFVFIENEEIYRQINPSYYENYNFLMKSGLYDELIQKGLIIPHMECKNHIIKPEKVFISYPYEWCFSEYQDAAAATLEIEKTALKYGMNLKDASAYNIQFYNGKPVLIDTLSFEKYIEGSLWSAYGQFCRHFLAPLSLMSYTDLRLSCLMKNYTDGIPLDLTSKLLPLKTKFNFGLLANIHMHAKFCAMHQSDAKKIKASLPKFQREALVNNLLSSVTKLKPFMQKTEWEDYYTFTNYDDTAFENKKAFVSKCIDYIKSNSLVWDLGGNTGVFSRIFSDRGIKTVSFDIDFRAIEKSYKMAKERQETNILPLIMDLTNPSSSTGFANEERDSLTQRAKNVDLVIALALIHHLAISNNIPLDKAAEFLSRLSNNLIIEFVPKEDSRVKRMLESREDIFPDYNTEGFERAFLQYYKIIDRHTIPKTKRTLYFLKKLQSI